MLRQGTYLNAKKLILDFVEEVLVYDDRVEVKLNTVSFILSGVDNGDVVKVEREDLYVEHSQTHYHNFLKEGGYKYSREVSSYGELK